MTPVFRVTEHIVDGQHIRQYPGCSSHHSARLKLCVKQYTPLSNLAPKAGDITVIVAHANGLPKELYEPLLDALMQAAQLAPSKVRNIWSADVIDQGASGILNEADLGNESSPFDYSRDLLTMVNHFRDEMPMPLYGIGHSMGAVSLNFLSFFHPRLFTALIFIEPSVAPHRSREADKVMKYYVSKPDTWKSRAEAEKYIRNDRMYNTWDPRVIEKLLENGLRSTSSQPCSGVALTTSKHRLVFALGRPNFQNIGQDGKIVSIEARETHPDFDAENKSRYPFYKPEGREAMKLLPFVRPPLLLVYGNQSTFLVKEYREAILNSAGTGPGGSGGAVLGQVTEIYLQGGHSLPMENIEGLAKEIATFLAAQSRAWNEQDERWRQHWERRTAEQRRTVDAEYMAQVRGLAKAPKL